MKNKIILLISSIFLLLASFTLVYALLIDNKTKGPIRYNVGKLDYKIEGSLKSDYLIYPGLNLVNETFKIINTSTVDSEIRIKLEFYFDDVLISDINNYILENLSFTGFTYNSSDSYYYRTLNAGNNNIVFLEALTFNGDIIKSDYSGKNFKIKFLFNAKQKEHANFNDFGETWFS